MHTTNKPFHLVKVCQATTNKKLTSQTQKSVRPRLLIYSPLCLEATVFMFKIWYWIFKILIFFYMTWNSSRSFFFFMRYFLNAESPRQTGLSLLSLVLADTIYGLVWYQFIPTTDLPFTPLWLTIELSRTDNLTKERKVSISTISGLRRVGEDGIIFPSCAVENCMSAAVITTTQLDAGILGDNVELGGTYIDKLNIIVHEWKTWNALFLPWQESEAII